MADNEIGVVTRYFGKISVAAIMLTGTLKVGARIRIQGTTTDFEQDVDSLEIDRKPIEQATSGQEIAIKVKERVRENDKVFSVG